MSNYTLNLQQTNNKHVTTWVFTDKEKAIDRAYQLFKSIFYRLNPCGNDPDCVDENGERLMFVIKNKNGFYYLRTKMNGIIEIKIWLN